MAGLGRVHEQRRRAGGGQGCGDLAGDVAAFAYAHHDHTALHPQRQPQGLHKGRAQVLFQAQHGGGFDVQGFVGQPEGSGFIQDCGNAHRTILSGECCALVKLADK